MNRVRENDEDSQDEDAGGGSSEIGVKLLLAFVPQSDRQCVQVRFSPQSLESLYERDRLIRV